MNWFVLAVLASLFLSLSIVSQKNVFKRIRVSPLTAVAWLQIFTGLILIFLLPFQKLVYPTSYALWLGVLVMVVFYAVGNVLYIIGLEKIDVSEATLLFSALPAWTFLGGLLFLSEPVTAGKLAGILLVVFGLLVVYYQGKLPWSRYHRLTVLASLIIGAGMVSDRFLIGSFSPIFYGTLSWTLPGLLTLALPVARKEIRLIRPKGWLFLFLPAVFAAAFALSVYKSYQAGGEVSRIGPILRLSTIVTIFLGYFLFKEKQEMARKLIGGVIVIIGVVLLS